MSNLLLARWQFGITTIFHFFFVPLSIGLVFLIAFMETMYVSKKDETYKQMAQFWGKLFLINFAVGVVTGILQEFQFGMNWSDYSRFVGDVFGAPLAVEALASFFLESTFLGIWIFGWDKLSNRVHLLSIWLVAIGTTISAFWILTANAFMQEPVGYTLRSGHAEMSSFGALITSRQLWLEFPHVWFGAMSTGAFFMLGVSAWHLLRGKLQEGFKRSFQIAAVVGLVSSILVGVVGHEQAQHLVQTQPMKMAASEALWNTSPDVAPWTVVAGIDTKEHKDTMTIQIPGMLSLLSYNKLHGSVEGMNQLQAQYQQKYGPGNYIPPVRTTFWSFRLMVFAGGLMILLGIWAVIGAMRNQLTRRRALLQLAVPAIGLPYLANTMGWVMTEIGRQPWTVFGLFKTSQSVSPTVSPGMVLTTVIGFTVIYGILAVLDVMLLVRTIRSGLTTPSAPSVSTGNKATAPL